MVLENSELLKSMSSIRHPSALQFYAAQLTPRARMAVWNSPLFGMPFSASFLNRPQFSPSIDVNPPNNLITSLDQTKSSHNEDSNDDRGA